MANITIQSLEVESTALNQVSPGEMEKVVGGFWGIMDIWGLKHNGNMNDNGNNNGNNNGNDISGLIAALHKIANAITATNTTFMSVIGPAPGSGLPSIRTIAGSAGG